MLGTWMTFCCLIEPDGSCGEVSAVWQNFLTLAVLNAILKKRQTCRVDKRFDWLGIWFGSDGATLSPRAINNHREQRVRLFEPARLQGIFSEDALMRVQAYGRRWRRWADGMLLTAQK